MRREGRTSWTDIVKKDFISYRSTSPPRGWVLVHEPLSCQPDKSLTRLATIGWIPWSFKDKSCFYYSSTFTLNAQQEYGPSWQKAHAQCLRTPVSPTGEVLSWNHWRQNLFNIFFFFFDRGLFLSRAWKRGEYFSRTKSSISTEFFFMMVIT